jgi:hypothetical protein
MIFRCTRSNMIMTIILHAAWGCQGVESKARGLYDATINLVPDSSTRLNSRALAAEECSPIREAALSSFVRQVMVFGPAACVPSSARRRPRPMLQCSVGHDRRHVGPARAALAEHGGAHQIALSVPLKVVLVPQPLAAIRAQRCGADVRGGPWACAREVRSRPGGACCAGCWPH